jgi:hypothetical protein
MGAVGGAGLRGVGSILAARNTLKVDDLIKGSKEGRGTKGRSFIYYRKGGFSQASKEFSRLKPSNIRKIKTSYGSGRVGELSGGRKAIVRPGSSNGGPSTLEIQEGKNRIKFRYHR